VRVHLVEELPSGRLRLGGRRVAHDWTGTPGFEPAPLERQLAERDAPAPGPTERAGADAWLHTVANAIAEALLGLRADELRVGVCLPGLKSADGRGVHVLRKGPRLVGFADALEAQLAARDLTLEAPLTGLWDDGDAAAWGEEWAAQGLLSGVESAYVVAPGSGVAEGLKVRGRFPRVADLREHLSPPWATGAEDRVGMDGVHAALGGHGTIDARARHRDVAARAALVRWAEDLAGFVAERLEQLAGMGVQVERVVVGARGGALLADESLADFARTPLENALAERLDGGVPPGFLVPSVLRAAPAIGAAAEALGLVTRA